MKGETIAILGGVAIAGYFLYTTMFKNPQEWAAEQGKAAGEATRAFINTTTQYFFGDEVVNDRLQQLTPREACDKYGLGCDSLIVRTNDGRVPFMQHETNIGTGSAVVVGTNLNPTYAGGISVTPKTQVLTNTIAAGGAPYAYNPAAAMAAFQAANPAAVQVSANRATNKGYTIKPAAFPGSIVKVGTPFNPTYSGGISIM